jgi:hypothetical protein
MVGGESCYATHPLSIPIYNMIDIGVPSYVSLFSFLFVYLILRKDKERLQAVLANDVSHSLRRKP